MDVNSDQLFKEGKKFYIVGNYGKALEFLSKSCKIRERNLGHLHDSMFEVYYFLAKGYYMFSKCENELIGEGLEIDKDTKDKDADIPEIDSGDLADNECIEIPKDNCNQPVEENSSAAKTEIQDDDNEEEEQGKENLTYLQLAYETIECAKLVLNNQLNEKVGVESDLELKMADCCDLVGNIYLEEDVIPEAIDQYKKALMLRQKHLDKLSRTIAESYYNLGVAFTVDMRPSEAVEAYEQCREILMKCQSFEGGSKAQELAEIITDLDERINDCRDGERDYALAKESIKQFMMTAVSSSSQQPANDLTHLLRRKQNAPRSDRPDNDEPPSSKRKLE